MENRSVRLHDDSSPPYIRDFGPLASNLLVTDCTVSERADPQPPALNRESENARSVIAMGSGVDRSSQDSIDDDVPGRVNPCSWVHVSENDHVAFVLDRNPRAAASLQNHRMILRGIIRTASVRVRHELDGKTGAFGQHIRDDVAVAPHLRYLKSVLFHHHAPEKAHVLDLKHPLADVNGYRLAREAVSDTLGQVIKVFFQLWKRNLIVQDNIEPTPATAEPGK